MALLKWTFQQIQGPSGDRKKLELSGYNAPFGRPRKDPVIKEIIKSRIQTTRYPGANGQSRHAFGTNWEPTELKGRWMTKELLRQGKTAADVVEEWTSFVLDERTCRIAWGFVVSYTGYIEEIEFARESPDEIAWRMRIQIDKRDDAATRSKPEKVVPVADNIDALILFTLKAVPPLTQLDDFSPDFLDSLNNLAAELNKPAALMNQLAGRFGDLEKASFSTLQHFRGAITGMRVALIAMRDVVLNTAIDSALVVRTTESDIAWVRYRCDFDTRSIPILNLLSDVDRRTELALQSPAVKLVLAIDGDTWESISTRASGGPDKAGDIRQLNGIRYGDYPTTGESYLVP